MTLAMLPQEEAQKKLSALIGRCYGEDILPCVIQNHPSTALSTQQVFDAWKQYRRQDKLVICATCPADTACRSFAASLKSPKTALIDADMLSQMIAEHPDGFVFEKGNCGKARLRIRHAAGLLFNRRNAPRCLVISICMLALGFIAGRLPCLVAGLLLLISALVSLKRVPRPAQLF